MCNNIISKVIKKLEEKNRLEILGSHYQIPEIPTDLAKTKSKRDIAYLKYIKKLIKSMGLDPMTGLYHKEHFQDLDKGSGLYLFIDGDGLKSINDKYGHKAGTAAIKALSEAIKKSLRSKDNKTTRAGGDEFIVFIKEISIATGMNIGKRILKNINKEKISNYFNGDSNIKKELEKVTLEASIGVGKTEEEADKAMYKAKQKGRNRVEFYSPKKIH